jgi:hypothetical protein
MPRTRIPAALTVAALAAACSSGPSESDIKGALNNATQQANAATGQLLGKAGAGLKTEVLDVKKIGCTEDGSAYLCDIEMRVKAPFIGEQTTATKARFVKGSNGWAVSR